MAITGNGTAAGTTAPAVRSEPATATRRVWAVFTICESQRGATWRRIGSAFVNRDGSYNVYLEALPVNGRLHMREMDDLPLNSERP